MVVGKTALTAVALGLTADSRVLGKAVDAQKDVPIEAGTVPTCTTPARVAAAQKKLSVLQWAIPGVTGALPSSVPSPVSRSALRR
ncbi:MAG: hypothetical protein JWR55_1396 [Aeromicrobium sp.]|jgi:hypothetical protein|nr:hypothetical protein [Aeromicrobium sp.]